MAKIDKEEGIILALISRYEKYRMPRLNELKSRVDQGGQLEESDIEFLEDLISDAVQNKHLFDKHPEWQGFCTNVVSLYEEISEKALQNEKR
jgi:hypothetical protein